MAEELQETMQHEDPTDFSSGLDWLIKRAGKRHARFHSRPGGLVRMRNKLGRGASKGKKPKHYMREKYDLARVALRERDDLRLAELHFQEYEEDRAEKMRGVKANLASAEVPVSDVPPPQLSMRERIKQVKARAQELAKEGLSRLPSPEVLAVRARQRAQRLMRLRRQQGQ